MSTAEAIDPSERLIKPDGLPLAILIISSVFWVLSATTVSLRTYTRLVKGTCGLDDAFIIVGTVVYTVATGLAIYGVLVGLGRLQVELNAWQSAEAMKHYIIWILTYVLALATVKSSICITIMRIASTKLNLRITVYILLAITWASFFITFIGTLAYCRPVRAIWLPQLVISGEGTCASVDTFVIIGHVATVSTIVTDLALVVVPAIILWNTQMKKQAKLQAFGLLSFASVASIITMVRIPYVNKFEGLANLQFWVAHTMLCSNIETGVACIASSVPSLRKFRREHGGSSSGPSKKRSAPQRSSKFFTVGSQPRRGPTDGGFSLNSVHHGRSDENWERLHDGASDQSETPIAPRSIEQDAPAFDFELKDLQDEQSIYHTGVPARRI
ncbi:hypothetical protein T440DRAFT_523023 [Plenodomus tracheiphilus IPT5]|uniref:Rhodopsin domain-containing protein n=1 Tax=Plenodomus tracheiphilus IPT5 TaxID=1408161 RepID=A0A6A7ARQ9_9PLEO|nr:hypothetical protein T440DRAFT_523023 [Plenodomus tracheiphilus IPT5]